MTGTAPAAVSWWSDIGACPTCGSPARGLAAADRGSCGSCGAGWTRHGNATIWDGSAPAADRLVPAAWATGAGMRGTRRAYVVGRRAAWSAAKAIGFPVRFLTRKRLDSFQRRSLVDKRLAQEWHDHYLQGLRLPGGAVLFEFSYRKMEKFGFARSLGYRLAVQDVRPHGWWADDPYAWFQATPIGSHRLGLADGVADAAFTDGAIFDVDADHLADLFAEYLRILKPGGYLLIWAGNSLSRTRAQSERRWHGRVHSLDQVQQAARRAGFLQIDVTFEGYAPPAFATAVSMLRAALRPGAFKTYDYDSWLARWQKPQRRAYWLLRLVKTSRGIAQATA